MKKNIIITMIISVLAAGNVLLGINFYLSQLEVHRFLTTSQDNSKIANFSTLFIQKVLKIQGEVSSQDRLKLEDAVFATGDPQLIGEWQSFLASTTEKEAQDRALILLTTFFNKIIIY